MTYFPQEIKDPVKKRAEELGSKYKEDTDCTKEPECMNSYDGRKEKEGEFSYEVIRPDIFKKGTIVFLSKQDGTDFPHFTDPITNKSGYVHWPDLKKLKSTKNEKVDNNSSIFIPGIAANFESGIASRGTTLTGPTQEVRLGS